jgi:hypothetical protein
MELKTTNDEESASNEEGSILLDYPEITFTDDEAEPSEPDSTEGAIPDSETDTESAEDYANEDTEAPVHVEEAEA